MLTALCPTFSLFSELATLDLSLSFVTVLVHARQHCVDKIIIIPTHQNQYTKYIFFKPLRIFLLVTYHDLARRMSFLCASSLNARKCTSIKHSLHTTLKTRCPYRLTTPCLPAFLIWLFLGDTARYGNTQSPRTRCGAIWSEQVYCPKWIECKLHVFRSLMRRRA